MPKLALLIPPPLVLLTHLGLVYASHGFVQNHLNHLVLPSISKPSMLIMVLTGCFIGFLGIVQFKRAKTTLSPTQPEQTSQLVTSGIYTITRNPMYLGMALILTSYILYKCNPLSVLCLPLFIAYLTQFQIKPEEQWMTQHFSDEYLDYQKRVRRWL
jgi:protein-S-isoprenylcysteine O-methyltransferase Ste14